MKKSLIWLVTIILLATQLSSSANPNSIIISGCVNKKTQVLRVVDKCTSAEKRIQWSQEGPAGTDGVDGVDGVDGRDGINGKDGLNGRDGLPSIAGPKGESGTDGSKNTIYWGYIKPKDILTNSSRKTVVVNSRNLGLPVGISGQTYRFEASVDVTVKNSAQAYVGCYWTTQALLDKGGEGYGDFSYGYSVNYLSTLNPRANLTLSKVGDEVILVCEVSQNASVTGGYVSAEAIEGSYKGSVGD